MLERQETKKAQEGLGQARKNKERLCEPKKYKPRRRRKA
jgi:hypothetical protein